MMAAAARASRREPARATAHSSGGCTRSRHCLVRARACVLLLLLWQALASNRGRRSYGAEDEEMHLPELERLRRADEGGDVFNTVRGGVRPPHSHCMRMATSSTRRATPPLSPSMHHVDPSVAPACLPTPPYHTGPPACVHA